MPDIKLSSCLETRGPTSQTHIHHKKADLYERKTPDESESIAKLRNDKLKVILVILTQLVSFSTGMCHFQSEQLAMSAIVKQK